MDVQPMDGSVVFSRLGERQFDAVLFPTGIPSDWLARFFGAAGVLKYENAEAAGLIERAESAADADLRDRLYVELTKIFQDEAPATFLFPTVEFVVTHRRVRGLASPWRAEPTRHIEYLWLQEVP